MKYSLMWAFLASLVSCGEREPEQPSSPLKEFASSACKNEAPAGGAQALTLQSDAEGLMCVEWSRAEDGSMVLKLYNFSQPCAEQYLGTAAYGASGALELRVYKESCAVHRCGTCVFDFEYQLQNIAGDQPLVLRVGSAVCESQPTNFSEELTLPLDEVEAGIMCRRMDVGALGGYARGREVCGTLNMPCGDCSTADQASCSAGTTCRELGPNDSRCLAECETDEDCPGALTACADGSCLAPNDW